MADRKQSGKAAEDEEVPAFFKNLGSGSPKPRQKFCGMFCPVEGSSENKTIDFDSLSVGRGSGQVVAQQRDVAHLGPDPHRQSRRGSGEPSVESGRKVEIRRASGKEALQNIYDQVGMGGGAESGAEPWHLAEDRASPRGGGHAALGALPLASARAPRPARPFTAQGAVRQGFAGGRLSAYKGCPRLPVPGSVRDQLIPRLQATSGDWDGPLCCS
ncbi:hypothetical protein NN561_011388 [Cricetulus griseus]